MSILLHMHLLTLTEAYQNVLAKLFSYISYVYFRFMFFDILFLRLIVVPSLMPYLSHVFFIKNVLMYMYYGKIKILLLTGRF